MYSSCQQDIELDQFSQQNTHCRAAILQNSSLGAPNLVLSFMNSITSLEAAYGFSVRHPDIIVGQSNERVELDQNHFVFQSFSPKRPTAFKI